MGKETITKRKVVEGTIQKRTAQHPTVVPTDIYISKKSNKTAIIKRITRLMLKENHKTVTLHGLGAMVLRAVSIALATQQQFNNQIDIKPTTETITLVDDIIPKDVT
ncbi:hypothetical protein K501DRAFT_27203 [Backusella circina FSU 941]|nr:hypothetical protein K501DRAFT_27203 [Backusella circina FSU 941]